MRAILSSSMSKALTGKVSRDGRNAHWWTAICPAELRAGPATPQKTLSQYNSADTPTDGEVDSADTPTDREVKSPCHWHREAGT